jgi:hypothetical protein
VCVIFEDLCICSQTLKSGGGVEVLLANLKGSWSAVSPAGSPALLPARKQKFTIEQDLKLVHSSFQVIIVV